MDYALEAKSLGVVSHSCDCLKKRVSDVTLAIDRPEAVREDARVILTSDIAPYLCEMEDLLNYKFTDGSLLLLAFTHRSFAAGTVSAFLYR